MNELQRQISDKVTSFVDEVSRLARKAAMDTLSSALGGEVGRATRRALAPDTGVASGPSNGAATRTRRRRRQGEKRDQRLIAKIQSDLAAYILANPGQRIEQIKAVLGVDTRDLILPMKRLLMAKTVRSEGTRRATRYFPVAASNGAAAPAPKKGRPAKK